MVTVRQFERLWRDGQYAKLFSQCVELRPEASPRLLMALGRALPAAAMAVIRLDELGQGQATLCGRLIHVILSAQEADGGWSDALTTALCLRALMCGQGDGLAITRGLAYLSVLQKDDGLWSAVPVRRLAADPFVSAFIIYQLGGNDRFEQAIRADDARRWLEAHQANLDAETTRLWRSIARWKQVREVQSVAPTVSWS